MNEQKQNHHGEIAWTALEFPEYKKHPLWFVAFGLVMALLVLYGFFSHSWSTMLTFVLFGVIGVVYAAQKPGMVTVKLSGTGIQVNTMVYSFKVIKKFWIIYNPPEVKALYFETNALLNRIVKIELGSQDPRAVKDFLQKYLEEDLEAEESLLDIIARKVKF